jgi:hypothetical protein
VAIALEALVQAILIAIVDRGILKILLAAVADSEGFSASHSQAFDKGVPSIK